MNPCTVGEIALRPTGNIQGTYLFFNLRTGKIIACIQWTVITMPSKVIEHVDQITDERQWEYQDETTEDDLLSVKIDLIDKPEQVTLRVDTQISIDEIEHGDASNNTENAEASHFDLPETLEIVDQDMIDNESGPINNIKENDNKFSKGEEEETIF
jgi:hypothetical protein